MKEKFRKVFKSVPLDNYYAELADKLLVEDITINKQSTHIKIYTVADFLVSKKDILRLEALTSSSLSLAVDIIERFELDKSFSAKNIFEIYKLDIGEELKKEGMVMYKLFTASYFEFESENELVIRIPNILAYKTRAEKAVRLIADIFINKFSISLVLKIDLIDVSDGAIETNISANLLKLDQRDKKAVQIEPNEEPEIVVIEEKKVRKKTVGKGLLYGKNLSGEVIRVIDINNEPGIYVINVMILCVEARKTRNGSFIIEFDVTDFSDSITGKLFCKEEELDDILSYLKKGRFIKIKASMAMDDYSKQYMMVKIIAMQESENFLMQRRDTAPQKRIELCLRTKMSKMESVVDVGEAVKLVHSWGHNAIGISDYGVVHSFPDVKKAASAYDDFKVIYGMTGNMVNDTISIITNPKEASLDCDMVVFDLETTGFNASYDKIIEIGAVKISRQEITGDEFQTFVNPKRPLSYEIINLTHISDADLKDAPTIEEALPRFFEFCKDCILIAHNASFDMSFIAKNARDLGIDFTPTVIDTLALARRVLQPMRSYKLGKLAKKFKISLVNAHRARDDARATGEVFFKLLESAKNLGVNSIEAFEKVLKPRLEDIISAFPMNISFLVKNEIGRVNLYKMVSLSHINFYKNKPKLPKSIIDEHREGILLGSGNIDGELQQAVLRGQPEDSILKILEFYDYIEVQPLSHYLADTKQFTSRDMAIEHINRLIELGEKSSKLVVATGNVHFIEKRDEIYRSIVRLGDKRKLNLSLPLYLMTTNEMLEEFSFLSKVKAQEIVVTNTHKISDMLEDISPVRPDKCPPVIENSDVELRDICYKTAKSIYSENLPVEVKSRLDRELNSIISNGFAVMYIIAEKLVKKSNEDGYLVGSRGSVGSSLVATMSGITEVNPLSPHYYCKKCQYSEFDSDEIKAASGLCGCDLVDKVCPNCNELLSKDGFDIPFETFLGFKGNKEPDIDLNFSGEYQSKAHYQTEVIFGKGQTFRAGTISGVAEKMAMQYAEKYFEQEGVVKRRAEIKRIAKRVEGVKKTTGQHPGGVIVLPLGEDINSFTPIQRPADDPTVDIITTHFDYHSIDHNLLKLDILGHDDPTMIKHLEDLTGIDAKKIPLDEKKVMSIFHSSEALGVKSSQILDCPLGCRGIPEFGTDFTIQMVVDTKPKNFSDLVNISGLSHGTDVWVGNAKQLIETRGLTISECICTRDDIMTYLIRMGLEEELAFTIMESVRKGKGLKSEWEEAMLQHGVADWYIWSCKRIKYMFPKAHAVAYVTMAYRIAYFKVYYPLEYYTAFFSIRASGFNYGLMCLGKASVEHNIEIYRKITNPTATEKDILKDMLIVQEYYARGFEFERIDIYKAHADKFQIVGKKIMPSLSVIDGLGYKAAKDVVAEAKEGVFSSKENLKKRCKISQTTIDLMTEYGIITDLNDTDQSSIFDFM